MRRSVPYMECARRFLEQSGCLVIASELRLVHRKLGYAGTLDLAGNLRARFALIDFKSTVMPRTVGPQTAAYAGAYEDMHGAQHRPRRYCVLLNPALPNGYKVHELSDPSDWHLFVSALNCYRFRRNGK